MAGIAGILRIDGCPVGREGLAPALGAIAHRGVAGECHWEHDTIHLASCRHPWAQHAHPGSEPWHGDGLVVVADARFDNRDELAHELGVDPAECDEHLIAAAYQKWRVDCADHMAGDFAFGLWDERERRLYGARDALGVRPFYYHFVPGKVFAFASEAKGLLAMRDVPREVDERRLAAHLAFLMPDRESTHFRHIRRLAPGHWAVVRDGALETRRYWNVGTEPEPVCQRHDSVDAFRVAFSQAVRSRLPPSPWGAGAMLSGGLDSSSVVCTAHSLLADRSEGLRTFTARFPTVPASDEGPYVGAVLQHCRAQGHSVRADLLDPLGDGDRVLGCHSEPLLFPNHFFFWAIYELAHQEGASVVLDGHDGDTVVGHGWSHLAELVRAGRWVTVVRDAVHAAGSVRDGMAKVWKRGVRPCVPYPALWAWRVVHGRFAPPWRVLSIVRSDVARRVSLDDMQREDYEMSEARWRSAVDEHRLLLDSDWFASANELLDRSAWAHGVESAHPFLDRRLVELCRGLPMTDRFDNGLTRAVLRKALTDTLPTEVHARRAKSNLAPNFLRAWWLHGQRHVDAVLSEPSGQILDFVDRRALRKLVEDYRANPLDSATALPLFAAVTAAQWLAWCSGSQRDFWPVLEPRLVA